MDINKNRKGEEGFWNTFLDYPVAPCWQQELYNYFICGYPPGSFHEALIANNLYRAAIHTHDSNYWIEVARFSKWIGANAPEGSWGSYENVARWLAKSSEKRRKVCEKKGWVLTEQELSWKLVSEKS